MNLTRQIRCLILFGALITPAIGSMAQQLSVLPQTLLSRDTVARLRVTTVTPFALGRESVTMVNNKLTVTMRSFDNAPDAGPAPPADDVSTTSADVVLGRFPQGSYTVDVLFLDRKTAMFSPVGTAQFTVAEDIPARMSGFPAYDFTDLWWNPAESGWGISLHAKRNTLFAAWFVYDATGKPTWYTLQMGSWQTPNRYSGWIFATRAAPNSGVGPMSSLTVAEVGSGTLTFNSYDQADFTYTVDGVLNFKNIMREAF
ncbi:MAG: hypothetical protein IPP88_09150 [Betaproteobacteria bacterium]|nr:hypothetical protein [Betaproteobacteria bacterium]